MRHSLALARENLLGFGRRVRFHRGTFIDLFEDFDLPAPGRFRRPGGPGNLHRAVAGGPARFFPSAWTGRWTCARTRACGGLTAADVLNTFSEEKLADIFSRYGEVANSRRLAKAIIEKRLFAPWNSTVQLRLLVEDLCHWRPRRGLGASRGQGLSGPAHLRQPRARGPRLLAGKDTRAACRPGAAWSFSPIIPWRTAWSSRRSSSCSARKKRSCSGPFPAPARPRGSGREPRLALGQAAGPGGRMRRQRQVAGRFPPGRARLFHFLRPVHLFQPEPEERGPGLPAARAAAGGKETAPGDRFPAGAQGGAAQPGAHGKDRQWKNWATSIPQPGQIIKVVDNGDE